MVVSDKYLQAQCPRSGHTLQAGDAVVHSNEHIGPAGFDPLGNWGREAVAVDHAVGHQVVHMACPQQPQSAYRHGAGGGAVAVVIGHDAEFFVGFDGVGQQCGGRSAAQQITGG